MVRTKQWSYLLAYSPLRASIARSFMTSGRTCRSVSLTASNAAPYLPSREPGAAFVSDVYFIQIAKLTPVPFLRRSHLRAQRGFQAFGDVQQFAGEHGEQVVGGQ